MTPSADLWRYTADSLFLLENPAVREAFFPTTAHAYAMEGALPGDGDANRIPRHQTSLFIASMVTREQGEMPSPEMAALWLDVKRLYVELRPRLLRRKLGAHANALQTVRGMGYRFLG